MRSSFQTAKALIQVVNTSHVFEVGHSCQGQEERRMKGIRYLADVVVCNEGFFSTVAEKSGSTTGENQNLEWMVGLWQRNQKTILC